MVERDYDFGESVVYGLGSGLGWALAIVALAGIREKLKYSDVPDGLQGPGHHLHHRRPDVAWLHVFFRDPALNAGGQGERKRSMETVVLGVVMFTAIVLALVAVILVARSRLVATGNVKIEINEERVIEAPVGGKLLGALAEAKLFVASACGGGGTCAQCRVRILEGGGAILPTETSLVTKREAAHGDRLSCQVAVKQDMKIEVPREVFGVQRWSARCARITTSPPLSRNWCWSYRKAKT